MNLTGSQSGSNMSNKTRIIRKHMETSRQARKWTTSLRNFMGSPLESMVIKAESAAPATSYLTNGAVITLGALTFNQVMILVGTILALATFAVNLYFQKRRDKREQEFHYSRMDKDKNSEVDNGPER